MGEIIFTVGNGVTAGRLAMIALTGGVAAVISGNRVGELRLQTVRRGLVSQRGTVAATHRANNPRPPPP